MNGQQLKAWLDDFDASSAPPSIEQIREVKAKVDSTIGLAKKRGDAFEARAKVDDDGELHIFMRCGDCMAVSLLTDRWGRSRA